MSHHGNPHAALLQALSMAASLVVHRTQAKQQQMEANMRDMERMAAIEHDRSQAAIMMKIVSATTDLANRKIDLVFETFRSAQGMIQAHHASLLAERTKLAQERHDADEAKETRMLRRLGEIRQELLQLSDASMALGTQANRMAQHVGLGMKLPVTPLIDY